MKHLILALLICGQAPHAVAEHSGETETAGPPGGLVFRELTDTKLPEIFARRRDELIERASGKLRSHDWWLWGLAVFDYDRDGDLDLIACVHGSTNGLIIKCLLKETGHLKFADATKELGVDGLVPSTDDYPLVFDFDRDGYPDVAGLLDDRRTPCLWNRQGRKFEAADFSLHPINHPTAVVDLNGDGYLDVYQNPRRFPGTRIAMIFDPEQKTFTRQETDYAPPVALPEDLLAELTAAAAKKENRWLRVKCFCDHDLDGDGRRDVVVSAFSAYGGDRMGHYLTAGADGRLTDRTEAMGLTPEGTPFHLDDLDGDGDTDLLIAAAEQAGLYLNDGQGRFALEPGPLTDFIKPRCPYLHRVFPADLDRDGDADLAVSNRRYGRECVFENLGRGEFRLALSSKGWDADPLVLADVNGDGRTDLLIGGAGQKENVGVFLNETPGPD
jgi:hypothetical protein